MSFQTFKFTLQANDTVRINAVGSVIRCTSGIGTFKVKPGERSEFELQSGLAITLREQENVWFITDTSGSTNAIELYIGVGTIDDSRSVGTGVTSVVGTLVTLASSNFAHGVASIGTAATLIRPAQTLRKSIFIRNHSSNEIFVGNSTVTLVNGVLIGAGGSHTFESDDAYYAISTVAAREVRFMDEFSV